MLVAGLSVDVGVDVIESVSKAGVAGEELVAFRSVAFSVLNFSYVCAGIDDFVCVDEFRNVFSELRIILFIREIN